MVLGRDIAVQMPVQTGELLSLQNFLPFAHSYLFVPICRDLKIREGAEDPIEMCTILRADEEQAVS